MNYFRLSKVLTDERMLQEYHGSQFNFIFIYILSLCVSTAIILVIHGIKSNSASVLATFQFSLDL